MELVVGYQYYYLTKDQYDFLAANGYNGIAEDFQIGPGGLYWAEMSSVDEDEYALLLENDLCQTTYYSKSTQPGAGM